MKRVSIIVMAAILAAALVGCANGAHSRSSNEPEAVGSSSQTASDIVDMSVCGPEGSLENEASRSLTLAVVFNDDDFVEHAYLW